MKNHALAPEISPPAVTLCKPLQYTARLFITL